MFLFGVQKQTTKNDKMKKGKKWKNGKISKNLVKNNKRAREQRARKKEKKKRHLQLNKQNVVQIFDHVPFVVERNRPHSFCTSSPAPHRQVSRLAL